MGDITKNISTWEIACKCGCGEKRMSRGTLNIVQMVRDAYDVEVSIHSACRCDKHNEYVGGAENSEHKVSDIDDRCHAIDFHVVGEPCEDVYNFLDKLFPNTLGLGLYDSFVHADDRLVKSRWDMRS